MSAFILSCTEMWRAAVCSRSLVMTRLWNTAQITAISMMVYARRTVWIVHYCTKLQSLLPRQTQFIISNHGAIFFCIWQVSLNKRINNTILLREFPYKSSSQYKDFLSVNCCPTTNHFEVSTFKIYCIWEYFTIYFHTKANSFSRSKKPTRRKFYLSLRKKTIGYLSV